MKLMSDDKSVIIFSTIFLAGGDNSTTLRTQLNLTRKQYYSRTSRLIKAGLVKRQKGGYFLTTFGMVIYHAQRLLAATVKNYWKLKAIDSLGLANNDDNMPKQERNKIIGSIMGNQEIKEILLSANF
jgi:predicted transcriptional regulator